MDYGEPLISFNKDGFGIKWPPKVGMPLNKEIKPNQTQTINMGKFALEVGNWKHCLQWQLFQKNQ